MIQLLNKLFETGLYNELYKAGIVSAKYSEYREIYLYVDSRMKVLNATKEQAATAAQVQFNCGRTKIYKALSLLSPKD